MNQFKKKKILNCSVCNSGSSMIEQFRDINLYHCSICDHCFTDSRMINKISYNSEYFELDHKNWFQHPNYNLFQSILNFIEVHKISGRLIDVGCGKGDFLKYLNNKTKMALMGTDLIYNENQEGIDFIKGDFMKIDFHHQFEVVVNLCVVEHISDIHAFMRKISEICCNEGIIITTTIDRNSILYKAASLLKYIGYKNPFQRLYSEHHLQHFNTSSIKKLLEIHRFSIIKIIRHNIPLSSVDMPESCLPKNIILLFGVWLTFLLGNITRKNYLQTVICQKS